MTLSKMRNIALIACVAVFFGYFLVRSITPISPGIDFLIFGIVSILWVFGIVANELFARRSKIPPELATLKREELMRAIAESALRRLKRQ